MSTDRIDLIRAEVERLNEKAKKKQAQGLKMRDIGAHGAAIAEMALLSKIRRFINSLPVEPSITGVYSEAYDTEVLEWLKEHGSEETQRIIMMTASHFAKWQKSHIKTELRQWLEAKKQEELLWHPTDVAAGRHAAYGIVAHKIEQL